MLKFYRMMSSFLSYGNKQRVGKAVQNLCSNEHEQPGEVLVRVDQSRFTCSWEHKECSSSPTLCGCSNSDVCICYPNAHFYQWIFLLCISKRLIPFSVHLSSFSSFQVLLKHSLEPHHFSWNIFCRLTDNTYLIPIIHRISMSNKKYLYIPQKVSFYLYKLLSSKPFL